MATVLLDTDILTEFFKGQNAVVREHADAYLQTHGQFAISAFTHYEIVRGLRFKSASTKLKAFDALCQGVQIYPVTSEVLNRTADLWVAGRTGGHPHCDADLIIAATALEHGRALITGNTAHFQWVPGLQIDNWR
jgi:tRNA(fMet)-specific endonuclease VapC